MELGEVDFPYLGLIREKWPYVHWRFGYYSEEDEIKIDNVAKRLKMETTEYTKFIFKNPESRTIENEIVARLSIPTYDQVESYRKGI